MKKDDKDMNRKEINERETDDKFFKCHCIKNEINKPNNKRVLLHCFILLILVKYDICAIWNTENLDWTQALFIIYILLLFIILRNSLWFVLITS